jgi:hypothetical protein
MRWRLGGLILLLVAVAPWCRVATAQELEPRAYTNLPVGLNFVGIGYGHSSGGVGVDASLPVEDAELTVQTAFAAYARSLDVAGRSAKIDVVLPYGWLEGTALVNGERRRRVVDGLADPSVRFGVNVLGAPALSPAMFARYQQDVIVGVSVRVTAPLGQYDDTRVVNLGTNRWSFKPEIGASKRWQRWSVDVAAAATLFGDNDDTPGGRLQQDPLYSLQTHVIRTFGRGVWAALDATWYAGGRTTVGGVERDDRLDNSRVGLTLALPLDARNSVKIYAATGVSDRVGTSFDTVGIAWQYRWGGGL